ncbi:hypothetical protein TSOC_011941 [Tetrabaena socialis]|uniref:Uncharacterized protein n=1 Tax=Tetrabaena socialis TaxID=47790 RepID=A0A2J7ZPB6_9CHLO|nr:hypothetical protein TSOC_011941 [Tetrabaena socialis]|eukprot:PNH02114.1 hypothetical protein TSOC_011941 [Tetrabaena socialis]
MTGHGSRSSQRTVKHDARLPVRELRVGVGGWSLTRTKPSADHMAPASERVKQQCIRLKPCTALARMPNILSGGILSSTS